MISYMISYHPPFFCLSCAINSMIFTMISYQYHMKSYMISRTYDISCTYLMFSPLIWLYIDPDIRTYDIIAL